MTEISTPSTNLLRALGAWLRDRFRWKSFTERQSTKVVIGIGALVLLALKFVVVPFLASRAVTFVAEGHGLDMEVGGWSSSLLDLSASAKKVAIRVPGKFAHTELMTIDELKLDLSLWRRLRGRGWVNGLRIKGPKLYLERTLSGSWNWQELGSLSAAPPPDSQGDTETSREDTEESVNEGDRFKLQRVGIEDMRIEWVENLPGNSGGGLIHEEKATLFLDDMEVSAQDVMGLLDPRPLPTRVSFDARAADGKISMAGQANLFSWSRTLPGKGKALVAQPKPVWAPSFKTNLYLENIGAGAFARLTPEVAIRPARGTMSGTVELSLQNYDFTCTANLEVRDITFAVNRNSPLLKRRGAEVERSVAKMRPISGRYQFECGGLGTEKGFRPVQAFLSRVTRETLKDARAPVLVQAAAAADHTRYTTEPLDRQYLSTVNSMIEGVDREVVGWLETANKLGITQERVQTGFGIPGSFPGRFR